MGFEFFKRFALTASVILVGTVFSKILFFPAPTKEVAEETPLQEIRKTLDRKIASIGKEAQENNGSTTMAFEPKLTSSRSQFEEVTDPESTSGEQAGDSSSSDEATTAPNKEKGKAQNSQKKTASRGAAASSSSSPASSAAPSSSSSSSRASGRSGLPGIVTGSLPFANGAATPSNPNQSGAQQGTNSSNFRCHPSLGGGAYGNPISVALSCNSNAVIKYCIQEGSCCDPVGEGMTYSQPIVIGANDGNYCLTFFGASAGKGSGILQQNYLISNTLPHLQVSVPKNHYQTTQLPGVHYLQTNHFGETGFTIGELNLKHHDPGPLALNMTCSDIVTSYSALTLPSPEEMFSALLTSSVPAGNQLNVPYPLSKLVYGNNFITSFVTNKKYAADLHSCSTNKVVISDFELFSLEASHGETGTNSVREFSGGFTGYSFFETETNLNRTPAGASVQEEAGQELRTSSFGIFY